MELTKEEKAYLELYKGENGEEALREWKGELSFYEKGLYLTQLSSGRINAFLNFLTYPKDETLEELTVYNLDIVLMTIMSLSVIACKCAIEDMYDDGMTVFRYEHKDNIESYKTGNLCGFKSTSFSREGVEIFNDGKKPLLEFHTEGFCPYIPVNRLTDMGRFNDEYECLLPPYLNCRINDNTVNVYFDNENDIYDYGALKEASDNFVKQLMEDQKQGVVSDKLKEYCKTINGFLRYSIRGVYQKYNDMYNEIKNTK